MTTGTSTARSASPIRTSRRVTVVPRTSAVSLSCLPIFLIITCAVVGGVSASYPQLAFLEHRKSLQEAAEIAFSPSSSPVPPPPVPSDDGALRYTRPRVYHVTDYGADPSGQADSTDAINRAVADAFSKPLQGRFLMKGIPDLGGAEVDLDGGSYLVSSPITLPPSGGANFKIHGGSLRASDGFPTDGYLIELRRNTSASPSTAEYDYEYITLRDLLLDCNRRGGGVAVFNSLRVTLDNLYVAHFETDGVLVQGGHEAYLRSSYLGQTITAGADPGERNFSGTGVRLAGNDHSVSDVVIFSAAVGIVIAGQANTITNVHCYNKAAGWGGVGIHVKLPGLSQTRILNSYLDYTGIVADDPVQLLVSGCFFLGDAQVVLHSTAGVMKGVTIVDNMFSGSGKGIGIVALQGTFSDVERVVVDRNDAKGMAIKSTVARGSAQGNGTAWTVDFSPVLLFPDRIENIQYTLITKTANDSSSSKSSTAFVSHRIKSVADNKVVVEADSPVSASVRVVVDQTR